MTTACFRSAGTSRPQQVRDLNLTITRVGRHTCHSFVVTFAVLCFSARMSH